jgi:glyoxylase-like metal-dependent hydrolase (beta-lactamase superfamily II)
MQIDWVPVTRAEQNCAILWCEKTRKAAVIDPGGDIYRMLDYLEWENLTLELILVTHGHPDHAGGVADLAAATGARVEGPHRDDEDIIRGMAEVGKRYGLIARTYTPDRWLEDGDQVRFGEQVIDVAHCPGHTPGHVAYFHEPSRFAFVGDILFLNAIGNWTHGYGSLGQLVNSICSKLFPLGDDVQFLPGHGDTSTFGHERIKNPFVGEEALARWRSGAKQLPDMKGVASSNSLGPAMLGF